MKLKIDGKVIVSNRLALGGSSSSIYTGSGGSGGSGDQSGEGQTTYTSMTITPSSVTEDNSSDVTVTVVAPQSVPDGTTVGYTIGGTGITVDDITLESLTGTMTVTGGQASLTFRVRLDGLPVPVETATETLTFTLGSYDSIGTVVGLDPVSLTISNAPFYGSITSFSQPDNSQQYDVINDNVTLTRSVGGVGGDLWNSVFETGYDTTDWRSPIATFWAKSPETAFFNPSALNYNTFRDYFNKDVENNILSGDYNPVVMYSLLDNKYYEFNFTSWSNSAGGGFQYTRKKIGYEKNEPLVTVQDLAPLQVVIDVAAAGTAEFLYMIPYSNSTEGYHYSIDWGDGTPVETGSGVVSLSHDYAAAGTYTVSIKTQRLTAVFFSNKLNNIVVTDISQWGDTTLLHPEYMFYQTNIVSFSAADTPNLEGSLLGMFQDSGFFNDPATVNWDVSAVTNMKDMFNGTSAFNQNIGSWDVSSVTTMESMFLNAIAFNQDIGNWDVSNVTAMDEMFRNADAFNQDLDEWNTSSVTDMSYMFYSADAFDGNINTWNTGSVTNMEFMFAFADLFNQPLDNWDVSSVTTMESMFEGAVAFNQDLNSWDVSNVTSMLEMFNYAETFNGDITAWNTGNVTTMYEMFNYAYVFNQPIGNWDVSSVTDFTEMFYFAEAFNQDLNSWDTSSATTMRGMFYEADLFAGDISSWNVSNVTDMYDMFNDAQEFNSDISGWNVGNVTDMGRMFEDAYKFNQDLSGWDVRNIPSIPSEFADATGTSSAQGSWPLAKQPIWGTNGGA